MGLHGEIYPVHRLDQAVGGVMVYARTKQAAAALSRAIQEGRMEKEYLAVLTKPMAEPHGTLRDLLYHDRVKNKTYVVKRKRNGVKEAVLDYETLASGAEGTLAVVKDGGSIEALTGATVTSRAVTSGVNLALEFVKGVQ